MAIHALQKGQITRPKPKVLQSVRVPAPVQGIDARLGVAQTSEGFCAYTINMLPYEYGMQVRKGFSEHAINLTGDGGNRVGCIIPFGGTTEAVGDVDHRLFATTNEGIWDVTESTDAPVLKLEFADKSDPAGYGDYVHYTTRNGGNLLFFADRVNGLYEYDADTDTWGRPGNIQGVDPAQVRHLLIHKERLWLVEADSTNAWYLPLGAPSGQATDFEFGSKFKHGGSIAALFSWTVDGGAGVDDMFIAVSREGDVLVYQGDDPDTADTWSLRGVYFIGEVPSGTDFGGDHGGSLYLLSAYGVTSLNELLKGVGSPASPEATIAARITSVLRMQMEKTINQDGWAVRSIPSEGGLLISLPPNASILTANRTTQYYYNTAIQGWGVWRDVPMTCFDSWRSRVYFGTADGRVCKMEGARDEVKFYTPEQGTNGKGIEFSMLSSYSDLSMPAAHKRVHHIRADFITDDAPPSVRLKAFYDFDLSEIRPPLQTEGTDYGAWDLSLWDAGIWGTSGGVSIGTNVLFGGWGTGRHIAVAMTGNTTTTTRFMGWDVLFDVGGELI
jgi:hypothetical protein